MIQHYKPQLRAWLRSDRLRIMLRSMPMTQLNDFPLFARFQALWEPWLPTLHITHHVKDVVIAEHGATATHIWMVLTGWVSLQRNTPDGRNVTVGLCAAGDVFGEAGMFAHANYPYNAQVIQQGTRLVAIPAASLRQLSQQHADFSNYLMELLSERLTRVQLTLEQMSSLSASQRLGCFLLRLCNQQQNHTNCITMPIDKHIIASYLGMKAETLSRSFAQLQPYGIEVHQATISVHDLAKLHAFVCSSCGESGMCRTEENIIE